MADKAEKKPDDKGGGGAAAAAPAEGKKARGAGGMLKSTPVLLGIIMIIEAAVLFAGFKFLGAGSKSAHGAELLTEEQHGASQAGKDDGHGGDHGTGDGHGKPSKDAVELNVLEFKAPNKRTGRTFLYDVSIYAVLKPAHKEKVEQTIKAREATIKDRIRTIIAQSDPEKLGGGSEPGLETLRRQVKFQLDEIIGEGLIEEVLVPRCIPYRAEF